MPAPPQSKSPLLFLKVTLWAQHPPGPPVCLAAPACELGRGWGGGCSQGWALRNLLVSVRASPETAAHRGAAHGTPTHFRPPPLPSPSQVPAGSGQREPRRKQLALWPVLADKAPPAGTRGKQAGSSLGRAAGRGVPPRPGLGAGHREAQTRRPVSPARGGHVALSTSWGSVWSVPPSHFLVGFPPTASRAHFTASTSGRPVWSLQGGHLPGRGHQHIGAPGGGRVPRAKGRAANMSTKPAAQGDWAGASPLSVSVSVSSSSVDASGARPGAVRTRGARRGCPSSWGCSVCGSPTPKPGSSARTPGPHSPLPGAHLCGFHGPAPTVCGVEAPRATDQHGGGSGPSGRAGPGEHLHAPGSPRPEQRRVTKTEKSTMSSVLANTAGC